MKISLKWLNDYIAIEDLFKKPEEIAKILVDCGLEVESITDQSRSLQHVVVGHILEKGQHPDADKLTLCKVDVGSGQIKQIVCGARNHKQGDKVVVTLPGAVLPGNFEIKLSKIRGVESQGMLASEKELGLSTESEGILLLPPSAEAGQSFAEFLGRTDVILELSVTPNRADCLSHLGLARELSALLDRPLKLPAARLLKTGKVASGVVVHLEADKACPRYAGQYVKGVKIQASPVWLKDRLEAVGLNSINNVVDITNFVMMELGQPLHAFDADRIDGSQIHVRYAKAGEKMKALDGRELELNPEDLVIADANKPQALAGVIGGLGSGVSEATADIFIESAFFAAQGVRRSSRRHGVDTDSSQRFSRGTDPEGVLFALARATQLVSEIAGGKVDGEAQDLYPAPLERAEISLRRDYVEERLGYPVPASDLQQWLKRLGCQLRETAKEQWMVTAPQYRWDLTQEADFVEEYARVNGFDKIPAAFPALQQSPGVMDASFVFESRVHQFWMGQGYSQAINYNFINRQKQLDFVVKSEALAALGLQTSMDPIGLVNPLSEDLNSMRISLLPGLFANLVHNVRYGTEKGALFETGGSYSKSNNEYVQSSRLALTTWGSAEGLWSKSAAPVVLTLKRSIEIFLESLGIQGFQWKVPKDTGAPEFLHPGQWSGLFCEGRFIGFIGTLHPLYLESEKIAVPVAVAEFDLESLRRGQPRLPKIKSIAKFPRVKRDLAFVIPETLAAADVAQEILKTAAPSAQRVEIVDVFSGAQVGDGLRSVTYRYWLQKTDGSWTDQELHDLQAKIVAQVQKKFSVEMR